MATEFRGRGNLGTAPVLHWVEVDGAQRPVAELRVYFDRRVPDGSGGFTDRGGFWLDVKLWGPRAERAARILAVGARVAVSGELAQDSWEDKKTGEPRSKLVLTADHVDLDLGRIEAASWRPPEPRPGGFWNPEEEMQR